MKRLTAKTIGPYREALLAEQDGVCPLCREKIQGDAALDHDHTTGLIRGTLHRGCNALLGNIENNRARNNLRDPVRFARYLSNVASYITKRPEEEVYYPTHRTEDEKRELRNKRARVARAKLKGVQ